MRTLLVLLCLAIPGTLCAQEPDPAPEKVKALEQTIKGLQDELVAARQAAAAPKAPQLTPAQQLVLLRDAMTAAFAQGTSEGSIAMQACKASKGKTFFVAIIDGRASPVCGWPVK